MTSLFLSVRSCIVHMRHNGGILRGKALSRTCPHPKVSATFLHVHKQEKLSLSLGFGSQRSFHRYCGDRSLFGAGHDGSQERLTLNNIATGISERKYKRIVVMAGAGISTPSGIPDFRSPGSGLYDNLQKYDLPYPEAIFEINYFHHNPKPFFALAKELYPGNYHPNLTHYFVRKLHEKDQLLRMYTQNIDGLERIAGLPSKMLVEAHGTFATATCVVCRREYQGEELRRSMRFWNVNVASHFQSAKSAIVSQPVMLAVMPELQSVFPFTPNVLDGVESDIMKGTVPHCSQCKGVIKPDIVFFGEELPQHFFLYLTDFPMADLLIVMGTSLEVEPFASLAWAVRGSVPRLLINRDLVGPFAGRSSRRTDVAELGDVVTGVRKLADALGWMPELEALMANEAQKASKREE